MAGYLERYDRLVDEGLAANPIPERTPGKRGPKAKGKSEQLHIMKKTRFVAGTVCYSHKPSLWRLKVKYIKSMDIAHSCDYNSVRFSLFSIHIMRIEL